MSSLVGFGKVLSVFMLTMILSVNYPHMAALNYYITLVYNFLLYIMKLTQRFNIQKEM